MSRNTAWKSFDQLICSPSVSKPGRRKAAPRKPDRGRSIHRQPENQTVSAVDEWEIEDNESDEDTPYLKGHESVALLPTCPSSMPQSINPADVTVARRDPSDSEIDDFSEDELLPQPESSTDSSASDDCLAISCTRTKMTRLRFNDKPNLKRRRITDDMDVSFGVTSSGINKRPPQDLSSPKRFKPFTPKRNITANDTSLTNVCKGPGTPVWKSFENSFSERDLDDIEKLPSSPEEPDCTRQELLDIEELPSSAERTYSRHQSSVVGSSMICKSFYVSTPKAKARTKTHLRGHPFGTLTAALNEKHSKQNFWQHAISSGSVPPRLVVRVDSIEQCYGRIMVRFCTPAEEDDEKRIENVMFLDPGDKRLRTLQVGMEVAVEADECHNPYRMSDGRIVHLAGMKLCAVPLTAK